MSPLESSYSTVEGSEYSIIPGAQRIDLKTNYVQMTEKFLEEVNKSFKAIQENTNS